jgi:hypothetical protein
MRALLIAGLLLLAVAPAAAAQAPPETRNFDDAPLDADVEGLYGPALSISLAGGDSGCEGFVSGVVDNDPEPSGPGDQVAEADCQPTYTIAFDDPQAHVSLRARAEPATAEFLAFALAPTEITMVARQSGGVIVDSETVETEDFTWTPLTVASADGAAVIDSVQVSSPLFFLLLDDLMFAGVPQPDTTIAGGPAAVTSSTQAAFSLRASVAGSAFECSLDGAPFAACGAAPAYAGLAPGPHSFRARARDPYGTADATPARRDWTVVPPPGGDSDPDDDGVPSAQDNCPDAANRSQADEDRDDLGNACELLPSGRLTPVAGIRTRVRLLSGEVFVKLPDDSGGGASAAQLPPGFVPLKGSRRTRVDTPQESGYVPLQGVATLPVGSTVDARKGRVAVTAATRYVRPGSGRATATKTGRFAAAIFTIRQARRRAGQAATARPPTDLVMRTPPGRSRACASVANLPDKGIVRALSGSVTGPAKGIFRAVGAASTTTVRRGTWITQDKCNGTLTEVGRGQAVVRDIGRERTVTVGPGAAYLARARLFAAQRRRASRN